MERIKQQKDNDCVAACVAMLTSYDLDELLDEYEMPMDSGVENDLLEEEYEFVRSFHARDESILYPLAYTQENLLVSMESPSRERWPELYEKGLRNEQHRRVVEARENWGGAVKTERHRQHIHQYYEIAEVYHQFVVHKGRIYDPQDPPYWPSLGAIGGDDKFTHDYSINRIKVVSDEPPVVEDLPRNPAGFDRDELPEYS